MEDNNEIVPWGQQHRVFAETLVLLWEKRDERGITALEAKEGHTFPWMVEAMLYHAENHAHAEDDNGALLLSFQLDEIYTALIQQEDLKKNPPDPKSGSLKEVARRMMLTSPAPDLPDYWGE